MSVFVSREVAQDHLRSACKLGIFVSVVSLLVGIGYGAMAGAIGANVKLPDLVYSLMYLVVPTMSDAALALAECGTRAVLFFLMGLFGILMFNKMSKTGQAFRVGQARQFRFIALLMFLLGFLPTLVGNLLKIVLALKEGGSPVAVMSFNVNGLCTVVGLLAFVYARTLVFGAQYEEAKGHLVADAAPIATYEPAPTTSTDLSPTSVTDVTETIVS